MKLEECIKTRRSIRKYKSTKISHDFQDIIALTLFSPSWKNSQIVRFTLIEDDNIKNKIAEKCMSESLHNKSIVHSAPNIIVMSYITGKSGFKSQYGYQYRFPAVLRYNFHLRHSVSRADSLYR